MQYTLIKMLLTALCLYMAYGLLLFLIQRRLLFPQPQIELPAGINADIDLERIWLDMPGGKVESWFLPAAGPHKQAAPALIFAHGNAELIDFWAARLRQFTHLGMGVLLVEYPGYGRSKGAPSQASITRTFAAAYDTLVARPDVDSSRLVLCGRSLGGGAICALAAERPSAALILMSTFTSIRSLARRYLVPGLLARDPFDNLAVVSTYSGPVLVVHGTRDPLIPYQHGIALSRAAVQGALISYDSDHNNCPPDWQEFVPRVAQFLAGAGILGTDE